MSLITRCPACGTAFKVVADQLKISDGWVRCGHCQHVFDGHAYLQSLAQMAQPLPPSPPFWQPEPKPEPELDPLVEAWPVAPDNPETASDDAAMPADIAALHDEEPERVPFATLPEEVYFSELHEPELTVAEPEPEPDTLPPASEWHRWPSGDFEQAPMAHHDQLDFVRRAQRKAVWRKPVVRVILWGLLLLLLLGVLLQLAWQRHTWLMEQVPSSKPMLVNLCQRLGCELAPQQDIDNISMDSSALLRRGGDHYVFEMVIKNAAKTPLATPALELTLTGPNDQLLARKVFLPSEWPQARTTVAPQSDWTVRLELIYTGADVAAVQGYRAVLFYP